MPLANLAIAKNVAKFHQLVDQLYTAVVIPGQIITIREVEGIDVPVIRVVAGFDDIQSQFVCRRDLRTSALAFVEEFFLSDFFRLGMVADEDDLDVVILCAQEAYHPEVETTSDVFF